MESLPSANVAVVAAATRGVRAFGSVVAQCDHSMDRLPVFVLAPDMPQFACPVIRPAVPDATLAVGFFRRRDLGPRVA